MEGPLWWGVGVRGVVGGERLDSSTQTAWANRSLCPKSGVRMDILVRRDLLKGESRGRD